MISVTNSYSQTFDLSILTSGKWSVTSPVFDHTTEYNFDNSYCYVDLYFTESKKSYLWTRKYYLSDTKPSTFDKSKVGKNKNGKYLIMLNETNLEGKNIETMLCYEIINVTQNKLTVMTCHIEEDDSFETQTLEWTKKIDYE